MKKCLRITFAYLAAVIGAGFASGSEIVHYFLRFGNISFSGIILSSAGFGLFSYILLSVCMETECFSFYGLTKKIMPEYLYKITDIILSMFMLVLLGAMISGFSYMAREQTGLSRGAATVLFSGLCFAILMMNSKKIISISGVLGIFIVFFICVACIYMINFRCVNVFRSFPEVAASAAVYTSYNTFSAAPMLCNMAKDLKTRKECRIIGLMSFVFCFFSLSFLWCLISVYYGKISLGEMPVLTLAMRQGRGFAFFYSAVIFASVLTSAVSNGFGLICRMESIKLPKKLKLAFILSASGFIASFGFANIVNKLYTAAGIMSFVFPLYLFLKITINREKKRIKE